MAALIGDSSLVTHSGLSWKVFLMRGFFAKYSGI